MSKKIEIELTNNKTRNFLWFFVGLVWLIVFAPLINDALLKPLKDYSSMGDTFTVIFVSLTINFVGFLPFVRGLAKSKKLKLELIKHKKKTK